MAEAKARFEAPFDVLPTTIDVDAAVAACRASARQFGPHEQVDAGDVTDIVLCFDQNLLQPAAVLVESVVANATGPVRFTILGRGLGEDYPGWLAAAFPDVPMTFMDSDHVAFGPSGRPRRITGRITVSTMDRLLGPAAARDGRAGRLPGRGHRRARRRRRAGTHRPPGPPRGGARLQRQRGQRVATRG